LTSFLSWLTVTRPHVHKPTETVFGGPLGVWVLAFALSRILQNMSLARSGQQVPKDIIGVIRGPRRSWSVEHEVGQCIEVLTRDVQRARTILQVTFPTRATSWKRSVCLALSDRQGSPSVLESRVSATSGVPNGLRILRKMVQGIEDKENEATHEEIDFEVLRVTTLRRVQPREGQDRSASGEYIHISNVSAWSETSDESIHDSHTHVTREESFHAPVIPLNILPEDGDVEVEPNNRAESEDQHYDHAFMISGTFSQVCSVQAVNHLAFSSLIDH
jgi:hypothetical protein